MKYCTYCGNEVHDEAIVCVHCGCAIRTPANPGLVLAIKIFMIVGCIGQPLTAWVNLVSLGYLDIVSTLLALLLPLAWCIPMTVSVFRSLNQQRRVGMGMKICVLLFVNTIAGVLLLCLNDKNQ